VTLCVCLLCGKEEGGKEGRFGDDGGGERCVDAFLICYCRNTEKVCMYKTHFNVV
jgi:hypothetical protein